MVVSLEEIKEYLRVDFEDEDGLLEGILKTAHNSAWTWPAWKTGIPFHRIWHRQRPPSCMRRHTCMSTGRRQTTMALC